ncbi:hypothetical protein THAOC_14017 [Thalassiosira oceanica]|uniref:Uncharacterized protein n=1 Tax=Thalassiosira oceanica TaxID=159749 RepID=K0SJP2_THAOC|nr:hypothetical protein THAOC_14017 [Thalassiosira oceanica]|eukprot:EJK65164.1 hypothetical protein THAOC_14017 [Thalassiosira oceanica]
MAGRTGCGCLRLASCLLIAACFAVDGALAFSPGRRGSAATKTCELIVRRGSTGSAARRPRCNSNREDRSRRRSLRLRTDDDENDERIDTPADAACWNPSLRRKLAAVSSAGLLETAYLTYDKLSASGGGDRGSSLVGALCASAGGGCADVLGGPYSSVSSGGRRSPRRPRGGRVRDGPGAVGAAPDAAGRRRAAPVRPTGATG